MRPVHFKEQNNNDRAIDSLGTSQTAANKHALQCYVYIDSSYCSFIKTGTKNKSVLPGEIVNHKQTIIAICVILFFLAILEVGNNRKCAIL